MCCCSYPLLAHCDHLLCVCDFFARVPAVQCACRYRDCHEPHRCHCHCGAPVWRALGWLQRDGVPRGRRRLCHLILLFPRLPHRRPGQLNHLRSHGESLCVLLLFIG